MVIHRVTVLAMSVPIMIVVTMILAVVNGGGGGEGNGLDRDSIPSLTASSVWFEL